MYIYTMYINVRLYTFMHSFGHVQHTYTYMYMYIIIILYIQR